MEHQDRAVTFWKDVHPTVLQSENFSYCAHSYRRTDRSSACKHTQIDRNRESISIIQAFICMICTISMSILAKEYGGPRKRALYLSDFHFAVKQLMWPVGKLSAPQTEDSSVTSGLSVSLSTGCFDSKKNRRNTQPQTIVTDGLDVTLVVLLSMKKAVKSRRKFASSGEDANRKLKLIGDTS
ncbi:uncharacterized protein V6R79_006099 [Siganus canaliculatus]